MPDLIGACSERRQSIDREAGVVVESVGIRRGNVYVTGWPAWSELDLVGKEVSIGPHARFKVVKRIVRCAATNVDPLTGIRDLNIPKALMSALGHSDCGIYAEVTAAGEIAAGNEIEIV